MPLITAVERVSAPAEITILSLGGELDATSYLDLINEAQHLYAGGTRRLLLDLTDLHFLSSAGLVSLHGIALIMRGQGPPDPEAGWGALHSIANEVGGAPAPEPNYKLLRPQARVQKALEATGFSKFLSIYDDREVALASFAAA